MKGKKGIAALIVSGAPKPADEERQKRRERIRTGKQLAMREICDAVRGEEPKYGVLEMALENWSDLHAEESSMREDEV